MTLDERALDAAARAVASSRKLVIFTGAGVSAESGIDTFRDDVGGLWKRYPPDEFATPLGLLKLLAVDPARVASFLRDLLAPVAAARPNAGHVALSAIERRVVERGGDAVVVTQNVDRLHQDAGARRVLEVHGSLFEIVDDDGRPRAQLERAQMARIVDELGKATGGFFKRARIAKALAPILGMPRPRVSAGDDTEGSARFGVALAHRPNVVLFGESLPEPAWSEAQRAAQQCDLMLVVGTSGLVYPAAALPEIASSAGAKLVGVGPEPLADANVQADGDVWLTGKGGEVLPALNERVAALVH